MLYTVTGRNEFLREEFISQLKTLMRKLPNGEHNIEDLGPSTPVSAVVAACSIAPFLCEKRLVIARGVLSSTGRGRARSRSTKKPPSVAPSSSPLDELVTFVHDLPEQTHLALVEDDPSTVQPFLEAKPDAVKREFSALKEDAIPGWITERVRKYGSRIERRAAQELAQAVGTDLRTLDSEIAKLATYAAPGQTIESEHVTALVSAAAPSIFALQDAVAEQRAGAALAAARTYVEAGADPMELLAQLFGVVRRLLIVKELSAQRRSLSQEGPSFGLSSSPYMLQKLQRQAAAFPMADLESAYHCLAEADLALKTGRIEAELAVELALAQIVGILPAPQDYSHGSTRQPSPPWQLWKGFAA